jgi:predicted nucleotidyltransferase
MGEEEVAAILADVSRWARSSPDVRAVALVGSRASGRARADSDVDLIVIADAPEAYQDLQWVERAVAQRAVMATRSERFGNVWSLFATLIEGSEIEFTFAERSWVKSDPPAPEVCRVVRDGIAILYDPLGELLALCAACGVSPAGASQSDPRGANQ